MVNYCCVPCCTEKGGHHFPKNEELNLKWRVAIKRSDPKTKSLWKPGPHDVVCRKHFMAADYRTTLSGERSRLHENAVPSVFSFWSPRKSSRALRMQMRQNKEALPLVLSNSIPEHFQGVQMETEIPPSSLTEDDTIQVIEETNQPYLFQDQGIQCDISNKYSIDNYANNDKAIQYYTGFDNYDHFMMFFHCLGPAVFDLSFKCSVLNPQDQLFLTLMKFRQAKEDTELSLVFGISESTVSHIILTWINFLYFQLKELDLWPSREIIDDCMPIDFKAKFPTTRVILDATEIPIQKPSDVNAQSMTWSSYKHKNTVKTMVGCTPRGAVSYVSDAYAGSASDRQIIEGSELLDTTKNLFEKGDSIMADRGIMVQTYLPIRMCWLIHQPC